MERNPADVHGGAVRLSDWSVLRPEIVGSGLRSDTAIHGYGSAMMTRGHGAFKLGHPWAKIGWISSSVIVFVSFLLGFVVLSRYQLDDQPLDVWSAICRGLGITFDKGPAESPQAPLRIPTDVAWTRSTLDQIRSGNAERGERVALHFAACHAR